MAVYDFSTITAAQAATFNGAIDSLTLGAAGNASLINATYLTAPEQVAISLNGVTVNFGTGVYDGQNLSFNGGGMLFVGGPNADSANGGAAADAMFGGSGADTLAAGDGPDLLQGNQGDDSLAGGAGNDTIYGGQGNDAIVLGTGAGEHNWAIANKGDDTITASNGGDVILGGQGNDLIIGGSGGDLLDGNLGDDTIQGGTGADTIQGEGGADVMSGGGGADIFDFVIGGSGLTAATADQIADWNILDRLRLPVAVGVGAFMTIAPTGGGTDYYGYAYAGTTYTFDSGQAAANGDLAMDPSLKVVAVQTASDVVLYADTNGDHVADLAVILRGVTLSAIDSGNFI